jgi:aldose 1-epimerase
LPTWEDESLVGKDDIMYEQHGGFCLETQIYPDAINQMKKFSLKAIVNPAEIYYHNVIYKFGIQ